MRISGGSINLADVTDRQARILGVVREEWYNRLRNAQAFTKGIYAGGAIGLKAEVELINPAASGITVIVFRAVVSLGDAGLAQLLTHNAAITTDQGAGVNCQLGGAAAAAHLWTDTVAALDGTLLYNVPLLASTPFDFLRDFGFVLPAGRAIIIGTSVANSNLSATYSWIEF